MFVSLKTVVIFLGEPFESNFRPLENTLYCLKQGGVIKSYRASKIPMGLGMLRSSTVVRLWRLKMYVLGFTFSKLLPNGLVSDI